MSIIKNILKTIALFAIVFSCTNNSASLQEQDRYELEQLETEIEMLLSEEKCAENATCDFIAFGSKPCGGPWHYLVYSTSINTELLKLKVAEYNNKEAIYNKKWSISSDCMAALPPKSAECIDGICAAIY